jgi:hypothetical protein
MTWIVCDNLQVNKPIIPNNKCTSMRFIIYAVYCLTVASVTALIQKPCCRMYRSYGTFRRLGSGNISSKTKTMMVPDTLVNTLIVATIDADIANIPTNEFAPIFAGGIAVMFGGLFSTLAVGFIIDKRNLYANIVADSYNQGADDAEFWKGLSEEEKVKTQELLQRLKESKEGGAEKKSEKNRTTEPSTSIGSSNQKVTDPNSAQERKAVEMFSDYGDD